MSWSACKMLEENKRKSEEICVLPFFSFFLSLIPALPSVLGKRSELKNYPTVKEVPVTEASGNPLTIPCENLWN